MIFVDSNIPMYLVGAPHPNKDEALRQVEDAIAADEVLVTSAEVLQEILHRYTAIRRPDAIQPAFDAVLGIVDEVLSVEAQDVERAKDLLAEPYVRSARDALHLAVMERRGIKRIMTFDRAFDEVPWIER